MGSNKVHALICRICEYVILNGKKGFSAIIKVINLEIGRLSWIMPWVYYNHASP
jgi:hypothetical protein